MHRFRLPPILHPRRSRYSLRIRQSNYRTLHVRLLAAIIIAVLIVPPERAVGADAPLHPSLKTFAQHWYSGQNESLVNLTDWHATAAFIYTQGGDASTVGTDGNWGWWYSVWVFRSSDDAQQLNSSPYNKSWHRVAVPDRLTSSENAWLSETTDGCTLELSLPFHNLELLADDYELCPFDMQSGSANAVDELSGLLATARQFAIASSPASTANERVREFVALVHYLQSTMAPCQRETDAAYTEAMNLVASQGSPNHVYDLATQADADCNTAQSNLDNQYLGDHFLAGNAHVYLLVYKDDWDAADSRILADAAITGYARMLIQPAAGDDLSIPPHVIKARMHEAYADDAAAHHDITVIAAAWHIHGL